MIDRNFEENYSFAAAYGAAALPLAAIGVTFHVYLPKLLVDDGLLSATFVGIIFVVARIWDAVLDPLMGHISDSYYFLGYRRKSWFLAALPFGVVAIMITNPTSNTLFAVLAFTFFLLWTAVVVPYEALGAELDLNEKQRLRLFSFREGAFILGTLAAAAAPVIFETITKHSFAAADAQYLMAAYAVMLSLSLVWCARKVKELGEVKREHDSFKDSVSDCLKNKPFVIVTIAAAVHNLAAAIPATLVLFFVETVLLSSNGSLFLCVYFLSGVISLPLWNWAGRKVSVMRLLRIALIIQSLSFFAVTFISPGADNLFMILVAISGIGYGGTLALFSTVLVSCIDYGADQLGERKEGGYIGLWSVVKKGAIALGSGIGLIGLGASGYVSGLENQSETVNLVLRVMYSGLPLLLTFISLMILQKFQLPKSIGGSR